MNRCQINILIYILNIRKLLAQNLFFQLDVCRNKIKFIGKRNRHTVGHFQIAAKQFYQPHQVSIVFFRFRVKVYFAAQDIKYKMRRNTATHICQTQRSHNGLHPPTLAVAFPPDNKNQNGKQ